MFNLFGNGNSGFFGTAFDLDFDGHLDTFERAADFGLFMEMVNETDKEDDYFNEWNDEW